MTTIETEMNPLSAKRVQKTERDYIIHDGGFLVDSTSASDEDDICIDRNGTDVQITFIHLQRGR